MIHDRPGVRLDPAGMARLLQSREVGSEALKVGRNLQSTAERLAPKTSGNYSRSFQTRRRQVPTLSRRGGASLRAGAEVTNTAPHANRVEASRNVLQRAAKQTRSR